MQTTDQVLFNVHRVQVSGICLFFPVAHAMLLDSDSDKKQAYNKHFQLYYFLPSGSANVIAKHLRDLGTQ